MSFYQGRAYSILHPTDFSEASEVAFAHALAIAIKNKADLTILHVTPSKDHEVDWQDFPSIRKSLERWGVIEPGTRKSEVESLTGIHVQKLVSVDQNAVDAIVGLTGVDSVDLLVMGTRGVGASSIFSKPSSSVTVAQRVQLPTLFVTEGTHSCVDLETGRASLSKILLAVDHEPKAQGAVGRVRTMLQNLGGGDSQVTLLHVGKEDNFPKLDLPSDANITWSRTARQGSAASEITKQAEEMDADLIVMVTSGKVNLWDIIAGSTVQNVLKNAPCPVFSLPG